MTVHLVIAEGREDYGDRAWRVIAVTRTKAAADRIRKAHREKLRPLLERKPRHPSVDAEHIHRWDQDYRRMADWQEEAQAVATVDMPDLPLELWLDKWRIESREVEG